MPLPSDLLDSIAHAIDAVFQDGELHPQQLIFVHHIQKITSELAHAVHPMPQTDAALRRIIPGLGDSFLQQQAALFGYARLLLEHPESFDGAILSEYQQDQMQHINQQGQALYRLTGQIISEAQAERRQQHHAPATRLDLAQFFTDEAPILQYFLRDVPVQLSINAEASYAYAARYHLAALIQHIITTLSHELIEYGHIKITNTSQQPIINIFCTGIQLTTAEIETLFQKNGRYRYLQRLQADAGNIQFVRESGRGASIQILLPEINL